MVDLFQTKVLELMNAFIPNKIVTINSKDAPWITPVVKTALRRNKIIFRKWVSHGRVLAEKEKVNESQRETNKIIINAKNKYTNDLGRKICDSSTGSKCFWTAFNTLVNKNKITNIPPIIKNDKYISNFKEKADVFNRYFSLQCRPLNTDSLLPNFTPLTASKLDKINFDPKDIVSIINKLNSKKASGHDGISIAMLKLCPIEISKPLSLIFSACLSSGIFPQHWKKANVQPVHKKIVVN